jgi:hypothetical protein
MISQNRSWSNGHRRVARVPPPREMIAKGGTLVVDVRDGPARKLCAAAAFIQGLAASSSPDRRLGQF